jgi:hypothetical protein
MRQFSPSPALTFAAESSPSSRVRFGGKWMTALTAGLALFGASAQAADWYVRPNGGSYGAADGRSWNSAFNGFSGIAWGSVSCGDTIWIAGGSYSQSLSPAKKCSAAAPLAVRRARADASGSTNGSGWSSSFASTVRQTSGAGIVFNGDWDHIVISGRTSAAGGSHGWWIDMSGRTEGAAIEFVNGASADYNTMEYMDLQGPGSITYSGDGRGIDGTPFSNATGNVFSHMRIFDWETAIIQAGMHGTVFEYLDIFDINAANWAAYHPNGLFSISATNVTVRYSKFHRGPKGYGTGEGIFFEQSGGNANWLIYGNVFYDLDESHLKAIQLTSAVPGLKVFNNTFDNVAVPGVFTNGGVCGAGSETRNNLFNNSGGPSACGTMSNNLVSSNSPFIDRAGRDYRIVATVGSGYPRNAGTNPSSLFTSDMLSTRYGADGSWDIGAYEYASSSAPVALAPPTGLVAR